MKVFFSSEYEKRLWLLVLLVIGAIFSTLFIGHPLLELFRDQNFQALVFGSVMILVSITILIHGIKTKPGKLEWTLIIGLVAVYVMMFLRLGLPERSHLMEYSVLAIFIHKAMIEREGSKRSFITVGILSFVITFIIGVIDEVIQYFIPDRVFDTEDILFNGMAVAMAIGFSILMQWFRSKKTYNNSI